jgi:serine/threonine protein kinase
MYFQLGDFGLARLSGDRNPDTSGSVSGTAGTSAYMAPEALLSGEITVLCDTFSYGVVSTKPDIFD